MSVSETELLVIIFLHKNGETLGREIDGSDQFKHLPRKTLGNARNRLTRKGLIVSRNHESIGNNKYFKLTEAGESVALDPSCLPLLNSAQAEADMAKSRATSKKHYYKKKAEKQNKDVAPMQAPLNISTSADALANSVSELIRENAHYRQILLNAANMIARELDLIVVEPRKNQDDENNK